MINVECYGSNKGPLRKKTSSQENRNSGLDGELTSQLVQVGHLAKEPPPRKADSWLAMLRRGEKKNQFFNEILCFSFPESPPLAQFCKFGQSKSHKSRATQQYVSLLAHPTLGFFFPHLFFINGHSLCPLLPLVSSFL